MAVIADTMRRASVTVILGFTGGLLADHIRITTNNAVSNKSSEERKYVKHNTSINTERSGRGPLRWDTGRSPQRLFFSDDLIVVSNFRSWCSRLKA
jgi:hypothetical protein